jgi:hypothetical protein
VIARIPFSVLRDIGASRTVVIRALGFSARIKPADLVVLRNYVDTLSQGVVIR